MSPRRFCAGCVYITARLFSGHNGQEVNEVSCPAQFNPREAKWGPKEGMNPHECPRNEKFLQILKQDGESSLW
jgi:hypothetical protein